MKELFASRELDALIAKKIFGYTLDYEFAETLGAPCVPALRDQHDEWGILPEYSTDMAAAWQVVERMLDTTFKGKLDHIWSLTAREAAEAICQAALEEGGIYARSTTDRMVLEDAGARGL